MANKLLIVDDDAELRRSLNVTLHQRGFDVDLADEGLSALKLIETSFARGLPYGCIVADVKLPDINGLKLLEMIKAKYPGMPVILITGYATGEVEGSGQMKGDGFLTKPFLVDDLTATVRSVPQFHPTAPPQPRPDTAPRSVSAYSLVSIDPAADAEGVFRALYFMDCVVYCDAVHGDTDVVMLINAPTPADLERIWRDRILATPGVRAATFNPAVKPELDRGLARFLEEYDRQRAFDPLARKRALGPNAVSTYLLVDVERGRVGDVFTRLSLLDGVLFCDAVTGGYDLVALVQTSSLVENDRVLSEELKAIDGIVRTMSLRVVNVLET
jgi:CheY-like chemotaxis protein